MPGTLHVFRRKVVNGGEHFQVNYTVAGKSFAKVLEDAEELRSFLDVDMALSPQIADSMWREIMKHGSAYIEDVHMNVLEATAKGMVEAPSEF
jgi:hypothetical protein